MGGNVVPAVSVSAARDAQGALQFALVNLDPHKEAVVTTQVQGAKASSATGRVLTAKAMDGHNTVNTPNAVAPTKISARQKGASLVLTLPPKSVAVVRLQ
jgi:alpha-N-arabinofuranosidase